MSNLRYWRISNISLNVRECVMGAKACPGTAGANETLAKTKFGSWTYDDDGLMVIIRFHPSICAFAFVHLAEYFPMSIRLRYLRSHIHTAPRGTRGPCVQSVRLVIGRQVAKNTGQSVICAPRTNLRITLRRYSLSYMLCLVRFFFSWL